MEPSVPSTCSEKHVGYYFPPPQLRRGEDFDPLRLRQPKTLQMLLFGAYKPFAHSMEYPSYLLPKPNPFDDCISLEM